MTDPTFSDFLKERVGTNWVLHRRTARVIAAYGPSVVCLSPKRYEALEREYREMYGAPYDKTRAQLYQAARDALAMIEGNTHEADCIVITGRLRAALKAEAAA